MENAEQPKSNNHEKFVEGKNKHVNEFFVGSGNYDEENLEKLKKTIDPNIVDAEDLDIIEQHQQIKKHTEFDESNFGE